MLTMIQIDALRKWTLAREAAEKAKLVIAAEQAARKAACEALAPLLPSAEGEGTQYAELPEGWKLKRTISYSRVVDGKAVMHLRAALAEHHVSVDSLIDWKPSLVTKQYRELTAEARAIIDTCITTTPGLPTLDLVPPKVQP